MGFGRNAGMWLEMRVNVARLDAEIEANGHGEGVAEILQGMRREKLFEGLTEEQIDLWHRLFEIAQLGDHELIGLKYRLSHVAKSEENPPMKLSDLLDLLYVAYEMTAYESGREYDEFFDKLFAFLKTKKSPRLDGALRERFLAEPAPIERHLVQLVNEFPLINLRVNQLLKLKPNNENFCALKEGIKTLLKIDEENTRGLKHIVTLIEEDAVTAYVQALMRDDAIFEPEFEVLIRRLRNPVVLGALMQRMVERVADPEIARDYRSDFDKIGVTVANRMAAGGLIATVNSESRGLFCERLVALARLRNPIGVKDAVLVELLVDRSEIKDGDERALYREAQIRRLQKIVKSKPEFHERLMRLGLINFFKTGVLLN